MNNCSVLTAYLGKALIEDVEDFVSLKLRLVFGRGGIFREFLSCVFEEFNIVLWK
jgi:hypothetical protein